MLNQKLHVLDKLDRTDPALYAQKNEQLGASIGQHMRHSLDHFTKLLAASTGEKEAIAAYDLRERGTSLEMHIPAAREAIQALLERLSAVEQRLQSPLTVEFMADGEGNKYSIASSTARELAFVSHHSIHHMAFIKIIATSLGIQLRKDVGVAPSTLQYEAEELKK
jgi:uncharacterized damage-inducible protein DinB